jgi:hypothetical protein
MSGDQPEFPLLHQGSEADRRLRLRRASVPWDFLAPHEDRALRNHDQTLERLAERGGLSPREALCVVLDRHWREEQGLAEAEALDRLEVLLKAWEQGRASKGGA